MPHGRGVSRAQLLRCVAEFYGAHLSQAALASAAQASAASHGGPLLQTSACVILHRRLTEGDVRCAHIEVSSWRICEPLLRWHAQDLRGHQAEKLRAALGAGQAITAGQLLGARLAFDGLARVSRPGAGGAPVYEVRLAC